MATGKTGKPPFVKMLWERGSLYEREVIAGLELPFFDLSDYAGEEKERLTLEAMQRGEPLIYGGRIQEPGLLGDPDLLRKETGGYVAGDIKSGAGEEGPEHNSSPKPHYVAQLALSTDILERKGLSPGRRAFVWDIPARKCRMTSWRCTARAIRALWQDYEECIAEARAIIADPHITRAAYSSACKMCHWYSACILTLVATDDLTSPSWAGPSAMRCSRICKAWPNSPPAIPMALATARRLQRHRPGHTAKIPCAGEAAQHERREADPARAGHASRR